MRISSRSVFALVLLTTTLFSDRLFCNAQEHSSSHDEEEQQQHEQQLYQEEQRRQRQEYYHEQQLQQERIQQEQRQKYLDQLQQEQEQQQQQQQHLDVAQDQQRDQEAASQETVEELKRDQEEMPTEEHAAHPTEVDQSQQSPDDPVVNQRGEEETNNNDHADETTQDEHAIHQEQNQAEDSTREENTNNGPPLEQYTIPQEEERIDTNASEEDVTQQQRQHKEAEQQQQQQHDPQVTHQDDDPNRDRQNHEPEHQQATQQMEQEASSENSGADQPQTQTHHATSDSTVDETASNTQHQDVQVPEEATPVEEDDLYVSDDEPLSTPQSERKPARNGSLKHFFDKVKDQEQNLSGETPERKDQEIPPKQQHLSPEAQTTNPQQTPPQAQTTPPQKENDLANPEEATQADNAITVWGSASNKRYADLEILGQLFHKDMVDNPDGRYSKVFEPVGDLVIPSLYSAIMGEDATEKTGENVLVVDDENDAPQLQGIKGKRSVNSEFVEGLDDIDKLFEDVDPPDEFDVGASGTSIQDVLMGQTIKIIIKRVKIGAHYTSRGFKALKSKITIYLAKEDRKLSMPKIDKAQLVRARQWTVTQGKSLVVKSKELFESFFGDDGDELVGDEFDELQKRLKDMTGSP